MLIYEYKLDAKPKQTAQLDEAIRVAQFVRNKCLRLWMDGRGISANDLQVYCSQLAHAYSFATPLNSQARQAAADRAWQAIVRFYTNCREHRPGKKGYPKFRHHSRSVEYKQTGWKLDPDGKHLAFTDGCGIGRVRLIGARDIMTFPLSQIKRVRLIRRADGYYAQFVIDAERRVQHIPTGKQTGIDVGLNSFYTDSDGTTVDNPRFLRKAEWRLRMDTRRLSRKSVAHKRSKTQRGRKPKQNHATRHHAQHNKYPPISPSTAVAPPLPPIPPTAPSSPPPQPQTPAQPAKPPQPAKPTKQSQNWHKARVKVAREYLHVQRQREDFARKQANALVSSHDLIALEDLQIRNLVKNRKLAKSISDVGWGIFRRWVEYYGRLQDVPVIAVPPQYTTQRCSGCGTLVKKSLSMRTHICPSCGLVLDRDHNAARAILDDALLQFEHVRQNQQDQRPARSDRSSSRTVGQTGT